MSTTTNTLTAEERHAATFALADDLIGLAKNLTEQAEKFTNASLDRSALHAADMLGAVRMISNLLAPLELVVADPEPVAPLPVDVAGLMEAVDVEAEHLDAASREYLSGSGDGTEVARVIAAVHALTSVSHTLRKGA